MVTAGGLTGDGLTAAPALLQEEGPPITTRGFEWTVLVLCTWLMAGGYLDSWAHRHLARFETFFTPWHAVLYSGLGAVLVYLAFRAHQGQAQGRSILQALPHGYGLSLAGCALFAVGGVIDMLWHLKFGFEVSLAALVSPPHLVLMTALGVIVTGPLRAAWHRPGIQAPYTAVVSATLLLSTLTFFAQFDQPLVNIWVSAPSSADVPRWALDELGVMGLMLQAAILTSVVLYMLQRFTLPLGGLTLMVGLNGALLASLELHFELIPVAVAGGMFADLLVYWLKPGPRSIPSLRLAAVLGPSGGCAIYMLAVQLIRSIAWPVTLWLGSIVVSGAIGYLLSCLAVPPPATQLGNDVARV